MIHPYQPGSLKGRILRALQVEPCNSYMLGFLAHCWNHDALAGALDELARDGYVTCDLHLTRQTWRLASRPPEDAA